MKRYAIQLMYSLLVCSLTGSTYAQAPFTALNSTYNQDFNTLITSGSVSWVNNGTIANWHHARTGSGDLLAANNGGSIAGALYSYGSGTDSDRALGSIGSSNAAIGDLWWGAHFVNNTGGTISALHISWYGEQWRYSGAAAAQTISFSYQTGSGLNSLTNGIWTNASDFEFTSPIIGGSARALDGNTTANRVLINDTLALTLAPGQEIMLRWYDPDHPGSDHGLAIDDFSITPLTPPGPTNVAFVSGNTSFGENSGTVTLELLIINPDSMQATHARVSLTSGTATNGADVLPAYTTQTITFPPGSGANQSICFTLVDDTEYEDNETLIFTITGVTGGNGAIVGSGSSHSVTIVENDPPPIPTVIITELFNAFGQIGTDEAVELYVVHDGLDLRGYSLADATSGGAYPYGIVTFSNDPLWSNLPAGTIIVIGGMFVVPIPDTDNSDGLLLLQAPVNNASNQYFSHGGIPLSFAATSDAVAVRDESGNFIHGIAYGSGNRYTLPTGRHGWRLGSMAGVESITFARSGAPMSHADFLVDTYVVAAPPSLGNPNDAEGNRAYLRALRSRNVSANRTLAGTYFWDVTVGNNATLTLSGPTNVGNTLLIADGRLNENGQGLSIDGGGNTQNGSGAGDLIVGDGMSSEAVLSLLRNPIAISGTFSATAGDATVEYNSTNAQSVFNAEYNDLRMLNGGPNTPKTIGGPVTVHGTLTIGPRAWLIVDAPQVVTLGDGGTFTNDGRFIGKISSTRDLQAGVEDFGGIGITLETRGPIAPSPAPAPGQVTVTMSSGSFSWVDNKPSILRQYTIQDSNPSAMDATMTVGYAEDDLNGQIEMNLSPFNSTNSGASWNNRSATLNTTANTLSLDLVDINGVWTMHAHPPQGRIVANPVSLYFEAEMDATVPASQNIDVSNAFGNGSIIEWTADASTVDAPTWLALAPTRASGLNSGQVAVSVTRSNLPPGTYIGTITITDPHAVNSPVTIPVSYRMYKPREISLGVDTLRLKLTYKKPAVSTRIPLINSGESFGPGVISWSTSTATPWLQITNGSGLEGDFLALTIDAHLFPCGTYNGAITITGVNSSTNNPIINSPLSVVVLLEVEPWGSVVRSGTALPMGSSTTFYNDLGHRIARIHVTSGTMQSVSCRLNPFALPGNIQRLRYAYRHYVIEATGTYTANLTLWYSLNELGQTGISEPGQLRLWRRNPTFNTWIPYSGFANTVEQCVTGMDLSNISGVWGMAYPFVVPTIIPVNNASAAWIDMSTSMVRCNSDLDAGDLGFIIERSVQGRDEWRTVGSVARRNDGAYTFIDHHNTNVAGWRYRLVAFDTQGSARQSTPIELQPLGILGAGGPGAAGFTLSQNAPNPVSAGATSVTFVLPHSSEIALRIFDMLGREIATGVAGYYDAGGHSVTLQLGGLHAGTYLYQLITPGGVISKKLLITQ